jgi:hypothetical protein
MPWVCSTWIPPAAAAGDGPWHQPPADDLGAVDVASGRFVYQVMAVACDNVIPHRSKIVRRWLATHPRLLVLNGARYSPMTTRSSAAGARSRRGWPTRQR